MNRRYVMGVAVAVGVLSYAAASIPAPAQSPAPTPAPTIPQPNAPSTTTAPATTSTPTLPAGPPMPLLAPIFTDNMVLQRERKDPIWGWAAPSAPVTVDVDGKLVSTSTAGADGKWTAWIDAGKAGGPHTVDISTGPAPAASAHLANVLYGDVWICSGQSNMQFGIALGNDSDKEIADADHPDIRLYTVAMTTSPTPQDVAKGSWDVCTPKTVLTQGTWGGFSAVGYFFGRDLEQDLNVPIGLIDTTWGGTPAEAWTSADALKSMPDFANLDGMMAQTAKQYPQCAPTYLYNAMVNPLIPFGIKGVIWYQGEANVGRAKQYATLLPTMIGDWRTRWGEGDFPFLVVQLAGFQAPHALPVDEPWADLREAQASAVDATKNTGLAVAIDIGDANDIHPHNKQEVGRRLALIALNRFYHRRRDDSGPVLLQSGMADEGISLTFKNDSGLNIKGDATQCFAIAGADKKFYWADAKVDGREVELTSSKVPEPMYVRYDWTSTPTCVLYNSDGLPAAPFRTDPQQ